MTVIDASVVISALVDGGAQGRALRRRLRGERMHAPEILDLEVISAWRRQARRGLLVTEHAQSALAGLRDLPITRASHWLLVDRIWELRDNATAYDAAYVALAELLQVPLLTADARLSRVSGLGCEVELLRLEERE